MGRYALGIFTLLTLPSFIKALMVRSLSGMCENATNKSPQGGFYLSFGGLAALLAAGGSPTLRTENPGLARVLSAAVFPPGM